MRSCLKSIERYFARRQIHIGTQNSSADSAEENAQANQFEQDVAVEKARVDKL